MNTMIFIFYFTSSIGSLSERDRKFIDKLKESNVTTICCYKFGLPIHRYDIFLYVEDEDKVFEYEGSISSFLSENYKAYSIGMYKENDINRLIEELKKNNQFNYNCNYNVTFICKYERNESIKFIKSFIERLEENEIDKVEIICYFNSKYNSYYYLYDFYIELYKNNITVVQKKNFNDGYYIERRIISNELLTELMKDNISLYCTCLSKKNELLRKYFLNYKLLVLDFNSLIEEGALLNSVSVEHIEYKIRDSELNEEYLNDIPDMKYLNVLLYFLKDSETIRNLIKRSLNICGSDNYYLFRKILGNLKIDFVDAHQIFYSSSKKILDLPIDKVNEYSNLIDDIHHRIRMILVKDDVKNYKIFLTYFFCYLKDFKGKVIQELLKIT